MYNEKIEKLIDLALADGELTEKEKQVLFKNAEAQGIDLDEFEMVLDAKLYQRNESEKNETSPKSEAAPRSDKYGDVKKCPACGAIVQSFTTKCFDCGHEFSNIESNATIHKLMNKLEELENMQKETSGVLTGLLGLYGLSTASKVDKQKIEIIKNFPIPNTREDLLEFLSLAVPQSKRKGRFSTGFRASMGDLAEAQRFNLYVPVWRAKCEQIIMKAKFSMQNDKQTLDEILAYAKELKIKV